MIEIDADENQAEWIREVETNQEKLWKGGEEMLEIRDYYRVWVKSPDDVPEERTVLYDREGGPADNHYYYEVPFQTTTEISLNDGEDVNKAVKRGMQKKARKEYPERVDLVDIGVPEKDLTLIDKAQNQLDNGLPLFGSNLKKSNPSILKDVESALTLLHLYKMLYEEGEQYSAFLNQIQKELGRRGIYSFEKISKARRYIDSPDEAPTGAEVEEGPKGGLYYETGNVSQEGDDDGDDSGGDVQEMVNNMPIDDWPEERAVFSAEDVRYEVGTVVDRYDEDIARNAMSHLKGIRDKESGSAYRMQEHDIVFRADVDQETIAHELGHETLASYGFQITDIGNMAPNFYASEIPPFKFGEPVPQTAEAMVEKRLNNPNFPEEKREATLEALEKVKERYEGMELRREDMHVGIPDDWDGGDIPDEVYDLADAVNTAWERQIDAHRDEEEDAQDYIIGKKYSATNAHETMAMTHEMMQGEVADPYAMENLYVRQQELLGAYVELFEPRDIQKGMLNQLYKSFGPNQVWDELPYPEVEGVLEE